MPFRSGGVPITEPDISWKSSKLSVSLCITWQPSQRPKTVPVAHACGLTAFMLVVPQRLHVYLTCTLTSHQVHLVLWHNCILDMHTTAAEADGKRLPPLCDEHVRC